MGLRHPSTSADAGHPALSGQVRRPLARSIQPSDPPYYSAGAVDKL